jgi:2-C-methyl-D-erythritol 4-phosphate cytidylyltransferase
MTIDSARSMGIAIRLVASPESTIKLTTPHDLILLQHLTAGSHT